MHVAFDYSSACSMHKNRIRGMKKLVIAWITGSTNQKVGKVVDRAKSEQHKVVMACVQVDRAKDSNEPNTTYATTTHCLSMLNRLVKK